MIKELYRKFIANNCKVSTDTRNIIPGSIFFALKGPNFNANEFAQEAINKGASYAVIDDEKYSLDNRTILVNDALKCLQNLALYHRNQFNIPVIGITGSNGKTTCKELIGAILNRKSPTLVTQGNLNNHIGVPLTLLQLSNKHDAAIIEMGASKPGDIKELAEIACPTHGFITNIGKAHIEGFGSLEGVISTKKELYDYIEKSNGILFCNKDDELLNNVLPKNTSVKFFGKNEGIVTGELLSLDPFAVLNWQFENYQSPELKTNLIGEYNYYNFLAAICVGKVFNVGNETINEAITNYQPGNHRSQVIDTECNRLIVDCYNANPSSTKAALDSFIQIKHKNKMVILGDMLELGEESLKSHQEINELLVKNQLNGFLIGNEYGKINSQIPQLENVHQLIELLKKQSKINDFVILLKGSRGIQLEKLLDLNLL